MGPNGKLNGEIARKTSRMRKGEVGGLEFVIVWKNETAIGSDIVVTLKDISEVQKTKAAIYTGCLLLMKQKGVAVLPGLRPWCPI